jgi:hypothetical protein
MISFKRFLSEGGAATSSFETQRASKDDVVAALHFVSQATGIPLATLKDDLLGSTSLTLLGKKKDSGDIDIAMSIENTDVQEINKKMLAANGNEGGYNSGTKVGSYAVPVGNGKKVQVDFMYVKNKDWAKFSYHSSQGHKSKYSGVVRKIILLAAIRGKRVAGEDLVINDKDGNPIIRVVKSMNNDTGMKRYFKMAKFNEKTGKYNKTLVSVSPEDIEAHLKKIGNTSKFSKAEDFTDDPKQVAEFIFGKGTDPADLLTAEGVIAHIKKLKNAKEILADAKKDLTNHNLDVPGELG